jgi:hypothetical protein
MKPKKIKIWEDRIHHANRLRHHFRSNHPNLSSYVQEVVEDEMYLHSSHEEQLVRDLALKNMPDFTFSTTVSYTGVILDLQSRTTLMKRCPGVPSWELYYHHMTVCLGELPLSPSQGQPGKSALGQVVTLTVTHIGRSNVAQAVKVLGFSSSNPNPHITLTVASGSKPMESNKISSWTPITPFTISGSLREVFKFA